MSSKQFIGLFAAIFTLGVLPLLLIQSLGVAGAGLSAGFMLPFHLPYLLLLFLIGVGASYLPREALVMLPLTFLLMLAIGNLLEMDPGEFPRIKLFVFGALALFAAAVSLIYNRSFLVGVAIAASIAYHLGRYYGTLIPGFASPLYFLLGVLIAAALLIATGVSIGVALHNEFRRWFAKLKDLPAVSSFLSFF